MASLLRRSLAAMALAGSIGACSAGSASEQTAPAGPPSTVSTNAPPTVATTVPAARPSTSAPASTAPPTTAPPTTTVPPTTTAPPPPQPLQFGAEGPRVEALQQRLKALGYDPGPVDGLFGPAVRMSVWAFQRINDLPDTGIIDAPTEAALKSGGKAPEPLRPDGAANRIEVDLGRRLLVAWRNGQVALISHISPGSQVPFCENGVCGDGVTPSGDYRAIFRVDGWDNGPLGGLYNPVYFKPAYAIHGALSVPNVGASHGCVRIPMHIAEYFPSLAPNGTGIHLV